MKLKLASAVSSPVASSLEVSMLHQPITFSFPKHQFSKSKSVVHLFQAGWFCSWSCIATLLQIVIVPFALYICALEKMPPRNADTAFVCNYDHDYN